MKLNYDNQTEMLKKIGYRRSTRSYVEILIADFLDSGKKVAKLEGFNNATNSASYFGRFAKKMGVGDKVAVVRRRNELFLLRKDGGPEA